MSGNSVFLITLTLLSVLGPAQLALSQCKNQTTPAPNSVINEATGIRDVTPFTYALSASDSFLARSPDSEPGIAPHDIGFEIMRNGAALQHTSLSELSELRREEPDYVTNFAALAVTRACTSSGPIYFVTMQYMGDATSPTFYFTLIPTAQGYKVSALPMISGGVLEVSTADPLHIRTWDNLHEDNCEACQTPYRITEYEIRNGKPIRSKKYRTRRLYSSATFHDNGRIRFIP